MHASLQNFGRALVRRWSCGLALCLAATGWGGSLVAEDAVPAASGTTAPATAPKEADAAQPTEPKNDSKPADPKNDDSPGQADLDEAVSAKLAANSLDDLTSVIKSCDRALERGLDEANTEFCHKLLAGTLVERARAVTTAIFGGGQPDPRWPQLRGIALADVERALKLDPDQTPGYLVLVRLQALPGGDRKKVAAALDEAVRRSGDDPATKFEALMLRASVEESLEKRLADYATAASLRPEDPAPLRGRGTLHLQQNKPELALADFDAALKLDPEHPQTHEARGLTLTALKRLDEARTCFERAAELAPKQIGVWLQKGQVNLLAEQFEAAVADADRAIAIDPAHVGARLLRCQALTRAGRHDDAVTEINALVEQHPDQPIVLRNRALVNVGRGRLDAAIDDLKKIVQLDPRDLDTQLQIALLYRGQKQIRRAIDVLDEAIAVDPTRWQLRYARADALLSIGKHREALTDYNEAIKQAPRDSGLLNNVAWLLCTSPVDEVRDGKRALTLAKLACEVTDYAQPNLISTLAAAHAELGDLAAAKATLAKALELADDKTRDTLEKELAVYDAGRPMRELLSEEQPAAESAEKPSDERK